MSLAHCVMEWTVLAVLCLCLCLPVWSDVTVTQPYRVESSNGVAQIHCLVEHQQSSEPQIYYGKSLSFPEVLRVSLLRGLHGNQELCSTKVNFTQQRDGGVERKGVVQCSAQVRGGAVELTVSGLKATDTDVYRCEIQVFFPPPYLRLTGNGTLIHVLGSSECPAQGPQRQVGLQGEDEEDADGEQKMGLVSLPVGILMMLVIIVLIIIIVFQTLQCSGRRRENVVPAMFHKADAAAFACNNV